MKNIIAFLMALVLVGFIGNAYAVEFENQHPYEGESAAEKLVLTGNQQTGNPGYLVLISQDGGSARWNYYLWVSRDGNLMISSYPTVVAYSSFPSGDWRATTGFGITTKVGAQ